MDVCEIICVILHNCTVRVGPEHCNRALCKSVASLYDLGYKARPLFVTLQTSKKVAKMGEKW